MEVIKSIRLINFKKFKESEIHFSKGINIFIGDNESGKSSILTAIDLVLSGSRSKVEKLGLDKIFNIDAIEEFIKSDHDFDNLPNLIIELYLFDQNNHELNGKNNLKGEECDGIRMICEPSLDLEHEISELLQRENISFPFEYYTIKFKTFSDKQYTGYKKYINHILIDSSQINNDYATKEYVKKLYDSYLENSERNKNLYEYRKSKENFKNKHLKDLNERINEYDFIVNNNIKSNLETDLFIAENGITIDNKGKGKQSFIKTEFALQTNKKRNIEVTLLEEPENHLSHLNMLKLIEKINQANKVQFFIATHNSMISSRLNLRNVILLNSNTDTHTKLNEISEDTAKFFMKSPYNNLLEFTLSKKVILVEGHAEYILLEKFYQNESGKTPDEDEIHIIAVGGLVFKRFLEIGTLLHIKTAIITDNDKDYNKNCIEKYEDYVNGNIKVFADEDEDIYTFEKAVYTYNKDICDNLFSSGRRKLSVEEYMLSEKAESAYQLLEKKGDELTTPPYITEAIKWIKE